MKEMMWGFALIILSVCETWSLDKVVRNSTFNLGSNVDLPCSNKSWSEMIYVIWNIDLKNNGCKISHGDSVKSQNTCNDGKSLKNTSRAQAYLYIPYFSINDVGVYKCEAAYTGGAEAYTINVATTDLVPTRREAWLQWEGNKMVAMCRVERGKPAANISWSHPGNSSLETKPDLDGSITVESRLELLEGIDTKNLSCIVTHPAWKGEIALIPKLTGFNFKLLYILTVVIIIVVLAGSLFFAQKKLTMLRSCRHADTSPPKPLQTEDVEEVEPYASYVQRVNSIYNS